MIATAGRHIPVAVPHHPVEDRDVAGPDRGREALAAAHVDYLVELERRGILIIAGRTQEAGGDVQDRPRGTGLRALSLRT